jgi:hypothetical protein
MAYTKQLHPGSNYYDVLDNGVPIDQATFQQRSLNIDHIPERTLDNRSPSTEQSLTFDRGTQTNSVSLFNTAIQEMLRSAQSGLGTRKTQQAAIDLSQQQVQRGQVQATPGMSPSQQSSVRSADMNAINPSIQGANDQTQTTQERLSGFKDVLAQTQQMGQSIADLQFKNQQSTQKMINDSITQLGSAAFEGLDPKELATLEREAGFPTGYLTRAAKTLKQQEIEAKNANQKLDTSIVDVGGRKVLINNQTGATLKDLGVSDASGADTKFVDINGKKYQINADGSLTEPDINKTTSPEEIAQMEKSKSQLSFLIDTANKAMSYSAASGRSGARKLFEAYTVGSTDYTNLEAQANTLKTNLLALTTDPNVKKFFGPQMSEADVRMMMAGGTTLNPELQSPKEFYDEAVRVKDLLLRMEDAVKKGLEGIKSGKTGGGNIITAPDGQQIEIIDDQQSFNLGSGGTPIATKDVKKIASAIKTVESGGNYQAKGASGEYGAYQFMPGTWTSWAGKFLGNANSPMTPANQEKVALSRIQELVNQGYDAHQIALIWNGGSPKIKKGVNSKGVAYDSGAYALKVLKNLG